MERALQSYTTKTTNTVKRYGIRDQSTIYQNPSTKNSTPQRPLTVTWLEIPAIKITLLNGNFVCRKPIEK